MQCAHCRNWIPDQAQFCQTCGKPIGDLPPKKSVATSIFQLLLALVLIAISGIVIVLLIEHKRAQPAIAQPVKPTSEQPKQPDVTTAPQPQPASEGITVKRISFKPGNTSEIVRGIAQRDIPSVFILHARAGQIMRFQLSSYNNNATVTIYAPPIGETSGPWNGSWSLESVGGDYRLVVNVLFEERTSYALEITIV